MDDLIQAFLLMLSMILAFLTGAFAYAVRDVHTRYRLRRVLYQEIINTYVGLNNDFKLLKKDKDNLKASEDLSLAKLAINSNNIKNDLKTDFYTYAKKDMGIYSGIKDGPNIDSIYSTYLRLLSTNTSLTEQFDKNQPNYSVKQKIDLIYASTESAINKLEEQLKAGMLDKRLLLKKCTPEFKSHMETLFGLKYDKWWYFWKKE